MKGYCEMVKLIKMENNKNYTFDYPKITYNLARIIFGFGVGLMIGIFLGSLI